MGERGWRGPCSRVMPEEQVDMPHTFAMHEMAVYLPITITYTIIYIIYDIIRTFT